MFIFQKYIDTKHRTDISIINIKYDVWTLSCMNVGLTKYKYFQNRKYISSGHKLFDHQKNISTQHTELISIINIKYSIWTLSSVNIGLAKRRYFKTKTYFFWTWTFWSSKNISIQNTELISIINKYSVWAMEFNKSKNKRTQRQTN